MKKVLILTASTGDGHNLAAQSLVETFTGNNFNAVKFDFIKESGQLLNAFVVDGYRLLAFNMPKFYGKVYKVSDNHSFNSMIPSIVINKIEDGILGAINDNKPDIIVSTHAFAVSIVSKLKKENIIDVPFVSIVTDFKAHYAYIDDMVDAYITGSEYTCHSMINRNVPRSKVFPFGIPIRKDFLINRECENKFSDEYFNVLLMGGGMGLKFITPVLKRLIENEHKLKIVVICGNNKDLKESLDKKFSKEFNNKYIRVLGYTRNIPEFMDEADVIITKPGGLTVSEAIAKRLPMLLPYAIPGQEQENMDFLVNIGGAIDVSKMDNINDILDDLIEHPETLNRMRSNLSNIFQHYSVESIVELSDRLIDASKSS